MGEIKIQIGDVAIVPASAPNPYSANVYGADRVRLLRALRAGTLSPLWTAWFAPVGGGARRISQEDVDWERSGIDQYDDHGRRVSR